MPKRFTETRSWNNKWEKELFSFYSIQEFERILQSSVRGRLSVSESSDLTQEMLRNGARGTWRADLPAHGGIRRDAPRDEESTNYHRKIYVFFFQMLKSVLQKMRNGTFKTSVKIST